MENVLSNAPEDMKWSAIKNQNDPQTWQNTLLPMADESKTQPYFPYNSALKAKLCGV